VFNMVVTILELMRDPVVTKFGHTFEKSAIIKVGFTCLIL